MDASYFRGKKVTLMGLGLLGRGVGDARFLAQSGADLIVTDLKDETVLAPSLRALQGLPLHFTLGRHELSDFTGRDLVLVAPKTPQDSPFVAHAKEEGTKVTMSSALAARLARKEGAMLVGITGTRGKTTTTQMIAHVLSKAGKRVLLGGNIQGVSTLALLPEVTRETILVLELDSWQLQGFRMEGMSPDIAVFTTFYADHQDYYTDMDEYLADKAEIFLHQGPDDVLVVGAQAAPLLAQYQDRIRAQPRVAGGGFELSVPGLHNQDNAACAFEACRALGLSEDVIREHLASFNGVPGRLELVREKDGIRFYNDTTATTPEATLAALAALPEGRVVLIMGGSDKGLSMEALREKLPERLVLLAGTGTKRLFPDRVAHESLAEALAEARQLAKAGDSVLLSPAFASFGMFANEYDRGAQFDALVRAL